MKNTAKILRLFLKNAELYNINQAAKSLNISVGSSFKILKQMEKNNIVSAKPMGNAIFYTLNLKNPEAAKMCELLLLEEKRSLAGYPKIYAESLETFESAELIILFGSVLTKKQFNDIDVMFLTDRVKEVSKFCLNLSKIRAKPVVPLILKKEDLIRELKEGKEAIISIMREGVILKGESVFVDVIKNARN